MKSSKEKNGFKIYALTPDNFEEIADKSKPVYVSYAEKRIGNRPTSEVDVRATGVTVDGQWCELYLDAGDVIVFQSEERKKKMESVFELERQLRMNLAARGFTVVSGVVSDIPVAGYCPKPKESAQ